MKKISILDKNLCYWGALSAPLLGLALGRILKNDEKYKENVAWLNKGGGTGVVIAITAIVMKIFNIIGI